MKHQKEKETATLDCSKLLNKMLMAKDKESFEDTFADDEETLKAIQKNTLSLTVVPSFSIVIGLIRFRKNVVINPIHFKIMGIHCCAAQ